MSKRILFVDDSLSMRAIVKKTLEEAGYEVAIAEDGLEGALALVTGPFDALVFDVNMPGLNGIELVRRARVYEKTSRTPIIMLTTESARHKIDEGREAGASGWMIKPFHPDRLLAALRRIAA